MTKWIPFDEVVDIAGGVIITELSEMNQAPIAAPQICTSFLKGWDQYKSFGFLNGWTSASEVAKINENEFEIWKQHFKPLIETLDRANQVGIVCLPSKEGSRWYWYFAFAFPTFKERPCGRILIQQACSSDALEEFETHISQRLPPVARVYYRVMGAMLFPTDLKDRFGILGIDESNIGSMPNEKEPRLGLEDWVPWELDNPAACIGYVGHPDELWIAKNSSEQIFLVGHDPGEVQKYMDNFGELVYDFLSLVDEERWHEVSPREIATMGYDALRAKEYGKAIKFYQASIDVYEKKIDEMGKFSAMGWLSQAYRKAGRNLEALRTAMAVIFKVQSMAEVNPRMKVPLSMAVEEASIILLARNEPDEVIRITTSIAELPKIRQITRWSIIVWTLKAFLEKKDKDRFLEQWKKLTEEIYEGRSLKFPPAEPKLKDILELARSLGWELEFKEKG